MVPAVVPNRSAGLIASSGAGLEMSHQVAELFPLHHNVIAKSAGGALGVAGSEGGNHGFVFGLGLLHPPAQAQLNPPTGFESVLQFPCLARQDSIASKRYMLR